MGDVFREHLEGRIRRGRFRIDFARGVELLSLDDLLWRAIGGFRRPDDSV